MLFKYNKMLVAQSCPTLCERKDLTRGAYTIAPRTDNKHLLQLVRDLYGGLEGAMCCGIKKQTNKTPSAGLVNRKGLGMEVEAVTALHKVV